MVWGEAIEPGPEGPREERLVVSAGKNETRGLAGSPEQRKGPWILYPFRPVRWVIILRRTVRCVCNRSSARSARQKDGHFAR